MLRQFSLPLTPILLPCWSLGHKMAVMTLLEAMEGSKIKRFWDYRASLSYNERPPGIRKGACCRIHELTTNPEQLFESQDLMPNLRQCLRVLGFLQLLRHIVVHRGSLTIYFRNTSAPGGSCSYMPASQCGALEGAKGRRAVQQEAWQGLFKTGDM
jgi:hypothetical protein